MEHTNNRYKHDLRAKLLNGFRISDEKGKKNIIAIHHDSSIWIIRVDWRVDIVSRVLVHIIKLYTTYIDFYWFKPDLFAHMTTFMLLSKKIQCKWTKYTSDTYMLKYDFIISIHLRVEHLICRPIYPHMHDFISNASNQ